MAFSTSAFLDLHSGSLISYSNCLFLRRFEFPGSCRLGSNPAQHNQNQPKQLHQSMWWQAYRRNWTHTPFASKISYGWYGQSLPSTPKHTLYLKAITCHHLLLTEISKTKAWQSNRSTAAAKFWSWHWECCSWPSWRTQRQWLTSLKQSKPVEIWKFGVQENRKITRKKKTLNIMYLHVRLSGMNKFIISNIKSYRISQIFWKTVRINVQLVEPKTSIQGSKFQNARNTNCISLPIDIGIFWVHLRVPK